MTLKECYDEAILKSYLDNALSAEELKEVGAHVSDCADCRTHLNDLQSLAGEVNALLEHHMDVESPRLAFARLQVAQRANGTAAKVQAAQPSPSKAPIIQRARPIAATTSAPRGLSRIAVAGFGVAFTIVLALGLVALFAPTMPGASINNADNLEFLPAGKVRHIILTSTLYTTQIGAKSALSQTTEEHREEFWLTAGKDHPLMRDQVLVPISTTNFLDDNAYYESDPDQKGQIQKYPYDPKYLAALIPDPEIVTNTLQLPNAHVLGIEALDGRATEVIQFTGSARADHSTVIKYWIDIVTNQLLQIEAVTTTTAGPQQGSVERVMNRIALDELKDLSDFPADFFTLKIPPGAVLIDNAVGTPTVSK